MAQLAPEHLQELLSPTSAANGRKAALRCVSLITVRWKSSIR